MGARCAGSDPDIVAMAQVAKRLKRVYLTGRCVPQIWRILLDGGPAFVWDGAVAVCCSWLVCNRGTSRVLTDAAFAVRGPSMLFQPPGLGSIKVLRTMLAW
jgi:hypothetical protein